MMDQQTLNIYDIICSYDKRMSFRFETVCYRLLSNHMDHHSLYDISDFGRFSIFQSYMWLKGSIYYIVLGFIKFCTNYLLVCGYNKLPDIFSRLIIKW